MLKKDTNVGDLAEIVYDDEMFYIFRMLPPNKDGHKYYYSLEVSENSPKETFINLKKKR